MTGEILTPYSLFGLLCFTLVGDHHVSTSESLPFPSHDIVIIVDFRISNSLGETHQNYIKYQLGPRCNTMLGHYVV